MIAITGASGQLGRLVIHHLLTTLPANQIVALARRPDALEALSALGVQVRQANYDRADEWPVALKGVEKLLLISSSEVGKRTPQHHNVIQGAIRAGVRQIAYTSLLRADSSAMALALEHRQTEQLLRESALEVVLLRNGWYTENYLAQIPAALKQGVILGCAGEGKISAAPRNDYAAAAAAILLRDDQNGKIWELAGDSGWTLAELAREISRQSGQAIRYQNMKEADFVNALTAVGLPPPLAALLADSDSGAALGALYDQSHRLSQLLGRPTAALTDSVRAYLATQPSSR